MPLLNEIHANDRAEVEKTFRGSASAGHEFNLEYRVVHPGGNLRWIGSMGRSFHNGSQRIVGVTVDITERKRASEILEQTVAERAYLQTGLKPLFSDGSATPARNKPSPL